MATTFDPKERVAVQPSQQHPLDHGVLREAGRQVAGTQPGSPPFDTGNINNDTRREDSVFPVTGLPSEWLTLVILCACPSSGPAIHKVINLYSKARRKLSLLDPLFRKIN